MNDNKRRRGRPVTEKALNDQYRLRMSNDMSRRLNDLTQITGMSKADIFREAFDMYEKIKLFQHSNDDSTDEYEEYFDYFEDEEDE